MHKLADSAHNNTIQETPLPAFLMRIEDAGPPGPDIRTPRRDGGLRRCSPTILAPRQMSAKWRVLGTKWSTAGLHLLSGFC